VRNGTRGLAALAFTALGIVYGDIGTSPLYVLRESFREENGVSVTPANVLGVASLIFWSLIMIVSIKYLVFAVRADNRGEGGILALSARVSPYLRRWHAARVGAVMIGLVGAALLYGDSVITPAISVLSAVEGLEVATPALQPVVLPITIAILVGLFALQSRGTARVGKLFAPLTLVWFMVIALLGVWRIVSEPGILGALDPSHAARFFAQLGWTGFVVLGSVFLAVTGGEALYADLGHFGRGPIRLAWFAVVLPALTLNYFGQAALLIEDPTAIEHPFYRMTPRWGLYPLVVLATAATCIASQAVITGAYSLTRQAIQLGFLPRMRILHTSEETIGQIYVPGLNWILMVACIGVVLLFQTTTGLAAAYGVAVSTEMVFTTILLAIFARYAWRWNVASVTIFVVVMLGIETAYWVANLLKVPHGGWFPLVVAAGLIVIMTTWRRGKEVLRERTAERTLPMRDLLTVLGGSEIARVPGTAIFLSRLRDHVPSSFLHNLKHNKVLHQRVIFLTVRWSREPHVPPNNRCSIETLGEGFHVVRLMYGFADEVNVPRSVRTCLFDGSPVDSLGVTYFVGGEKVLAAGRSAISLWRARLFAWISRNEEGATAYFEIPPNQVIEVGGQIEV
jgi:KUP system potassium uptake protein